VESFFGGKQSEVGIIVLLRHVSENEIAGVTIEAIGIGEVFTDRVIGQVARAGEYALLDDPGIRANLKHVEVVIGFEDEAIGFAEVDFDELGHVAEIGADGDFGAVGAKGKADGINGIVRDGEGVDVDVADTKALARLNGFDAAKTFAESLGENALKNAHGGLGDEQRSFPETEDLRKTVAMIGVLVSDEDSVEMIEVAFDGGEAGKSFAFTEASVDKDAGAFGFEQGKIARAAGRQDGDAQTDERISRRTKCETWEMMAERGKRVNVQKKRDEENWEPRQSRLLGALGKTFGAREPSELLWRAKCELKSAGEAIAGEGETVDGAEDGGGDLVGLEETASERLNIFAGDGVDGGEDFVERSETVEIEFLAGEIGHAGTGGLEGKHERALEMVLGAEEFLFGERRFLHGAKFGDGEIENLADGFFGGARVNA